MSHEDLVQAVGSLGERLAHVESEQESQKRANGEHRVKVNQTLLALAEAAQANTLATKAVERGIQALMETTQVNTLATKAMERSIADLRQLFHEEPLH